MHEKVCINNSSILNKLYSRNKNPPYGFTEAIKQYFIERREDDMEEKKIDGINTYMSPH